MVVEYFDFVSVVECFDFAVSTCFTLGREWAMGSFSGDTGIGTAAAFVVAFLISRVFLKVDGHVGLLQWMGARTKGSAAYLCLGLMGLSLLISALVPNIVAVLALLPLVRRIVATVRTGEVEKDRLTTVLGLGVVYGASMGGVACQVGSPTNLVMLAGMKAGMFGYHDQGQQHLLTFDRWLLFGVPMAVLFLLGAWSLLRVLERSTFRTRLNWEEMPRFKGGRDFKAGLAVCAGLLAPLVAYSVVPTFLSFQPEVLGALGVWDLVGVCGAVAVILFLFGKRLPESRKRLLELPDLYRDIPARGAWLVLAVVALAVALDAIGFMETYEKMLNRLLPGAVEPALALLLFILVTIFVTELVSSTAAAVVMWSVAIHMAIAGGYSAFLPVLGVTFASISAFMSPIATPATSMLYGGLAGMSLKRMLSIGMVVNIAGALWLYLCVRYWIPAVLSLY